ncbi:MAG: hypothetical protein H8E44_29080 [Planctomycetes bacterium]|nr:hypothetical protein [Planctomycetota bacterium]MBL7040775.1 hypothetical protein [Pirellulaceae bacterium]
MIAKRTYLVAPSTLAIVVAVFLAHGRLAAAPPIGDAFDDCHPTSLIRQFVPEAADQPTGGSSVEYTTRRLGDLDALLVEPKLKNAGAPPDLPDEIVVADWTFRIGGTRDAGYARLTHRNDVWYDSTFWQGNENWLRVGKDWHHPGDRGPSIRRFAVPKDGKITVTGRVYKDHQDGDGVKVMIRHNEETVWQHELEGKDGEGVDPNLTLEVHAGDAIRFVVHKRVAIFCDTTHWDPVITYADGQRFQASAGFSKKRQGDGGWLYEMEADASVASGTTRLVWFDGDFALMSDPLLPSKPISLSHADAQPCLLLADADDASGVLIVPDGRQPWQFDCARTADGRLTVKLRGKIAAGEARPLPAFLVGAYDGRVAAGMQMLQQWIASDQDELPIVALRKRLDTLGVPELDLWAMVQEDWRQQDRTEADNHQSYGDAIAKHVESTKLLIAHLQAARRASFLIDEARQLDELAARAASEESPRSVYLKLRLLKRRIALTNPLMDFGQLLFCKRVPTSYSHLVMQYYGWRARPGGGLFVLEHPGYSLRCRDILGGKLETGNVLEPRLSYDARRIVFSYVDCPDGPLDPAKVSNDDPSDSNFYHIYEAGVDGAGPVQLSDAPFDDMMPCYLPDGGIAFVSTRRKGYARCFGGQFSTRWDVYTLHRMDSDGGNVRTLSYHDTNEWFPTVSNTGHVLYARWDYIDRDAVTHQNLWASRADGTNPIAVWGNATSKPHCTFQPQPIPGSNKIIFTASAHHSIAAGPITIVDPSVAADGEEALERITPEIPFPEAESRDIREYYTAPWPLSEDFYLVGYSPYPLVWEPGANPANALGIYLLDRWGNRELIYRDPRIGSTNPCPLRPRPMPPALPSDVPEDVAPIGEMVVSDVYEGLGDVPRGHIKQLRIVQILPKTTNIANSPPIGMAREENSRAALGTVPVEPDGSARFLVPAGKTLLFQALDKDGFAYQTMRSATYVQPGERVSCVGCHEHKMTTPIRTCADLMALARSPSRIDPGPWGGRPFSYVEVVQPVLDKHCVSCHGDEKTEADIALTGEPFEMYSRSYVTLMQDEEAFWHAGTNPENAAKFLVPRYGGRNQVQTTPPGGMYGARGSRLIKLLEEGHEDVKLDADEMKRLALWIDLNAIFYGVYLPEEQARQLRGELVGMPEVQ